MIKAFRALSGTKKVLWGLGIFLAPLFIISAVSPTPDMQKAAQVNQGVETSLVSEAESPEPSAPEPQVMKAETKSVIEVVSIPFQSTTQEDASLENGKTLVAVAGINGEKAVTYAVTYMDGVETARAQVSEHVTKPPINEIKKLGTKVKAPTPKPTPRGNKCDPNYADVCVPVASDVDCRGGSGNGPAFVSGPLRVVGLDIYRLDRDGNGVGCE